MRQATSASTSTSKGRLLLPEASQLPGVREGHVTGVKQEDVRSPIPISGGDHA